MKTTALFLWMLLFPALHQWVTPAEAHVYETAAKLLTELFLEN